MNWIPFHPRLTTLSRYAEGELPPERRSRVARHLLQCRRCRRRLEELESRLAPRLL